MTYIYKKITNGNFSPELVEVLQCLVKEISSLKTRLSGLEQKVAQGQGVSQSDPIVHRTL